MLGGNGYVDVVTGDGAVTFSAIDSTLASDRVCCIEAVGGANLVLTSYTNPNGIKPDGTASDRGLTIVSGERTFGDFTVVTVTSGTARCYFR